MSTFTIHMHRLWNSMSTRRWIDGGRAIIVAVDVVITNGMFS